MLKVLYIGDYMQRAWCCCVVHIIARETLPGTHASLVHGPFRSIAKMRDRFTRLHLHQAVVIHPCPGEVIVTSKDSRPI